MKIKFKGVKIKNLESCLFTGIVVVSCLLVCILLVGEIKCIMKVIQCNWEPLGKAEIVYTASAACGIGTIVGWIDIEDK